MCHIIRLQVWVNLLLILCSGWGEAASEAQLLRCRWQRRNCASASMTCCQVPCKTCCEPKSTPRVCIIDELYGYEGYWLYYAHFHEDGLLCGEYSGFIYESSSPYTQIPKICHAQCFVPSKVASFNQSGLKEVVPANADLMSLMPKTKALKVKELAGDLQLEDGTKIHARVLVLSIDVPAPHLGQDATVPEWFAFGFESEDTGRADFPPQRLKKHVYGPQGSEIELKHLYEFGIGTMDCVIVTVKR
jgi:hypothetical protein